MKVDKVISTIESIANPLLAATWDLSGVQIAAKKQEIYKIVLCLDPVPPVLIEAIDWGTDFILSHHPLTLSPKLPHSLDLYHEVLSLCFKHDIWLYAAHTSLDVRTDGPVSWLAKRLSLTEILPIEPVEEEKKAGFGLIGKLPEPRKGNEFVDYLQSVLRVSWWLEAGKVPDIVDTVAYCPGSGMSLAIKAFKMGAQIFISGELKHHTALELEGMGLVIDVGHFLLEEKMMEVWADELKRDLNIEVKFFKQSNPIRFRGQKTN